MSSEFDLIARYFGRPVPPGWLGAGDDCALLSVAAGCQLAVSTDTLLEGRHFLARTRPEDLGHKALAVNISDLTAMGARPLACLLNLALPGVDHDWLAGFSQGFHAFAQRCGCPLIGGDTTRSESGVMITVTVLGEVPSGAALRRDGARPGDDVWISGELGAADVALRLLIGQLPADDGLLARTREALERPVPPWELGPALRGLAHAAIDISDGLLQDLGHILAASDCGAHLEYAALPVHAEVAGLPAELAQDAVLGGGDVYQLCFTAPESRRDTIAQLGRDMDVRLTRVGRTVAGSGLCVTDARGAAIAVRRAGFDHFQDEGGQH